MGNKVTVKLDSRYIADLFTSAMELNASDIHITEGKRPTFRIDGVLTDMVSFDVWESSHIQGFLYKLKLLDMVPKLKDGSINSSFTLNGKRFRLHVYSTFSGITIAMRIIPLDMPKFDTLNLPEQVKSLVKNRSGLVLVTGATGSGKSTTLASFIDLVNNDSEDRKLIVTIEDPVEFLHKEVNARIIQREVGKNVTSFEVAVRDALREDPDIILIGELQDQEAIRNALTLAETGHLVLGSLHTNGAAEAFDRIASAFPGDKQNQVRSQLSNSLQGVLHQTLVPRKGGGRVPMVEYLSLEDPKVRTRVQTNTSLNEIEKLMREMNNPGLVTLEQSAASLLGRGLITEDVAVKYSGKNSTDLNRIIRDTERMNQRG